MYECTIIKSEKMADRWEIVAVYGCMKTSFNGPADGLGPVYISWEMDGYWTEPSRVIEPERFAMQSTDTTAVRPAFNPSWVHNFVTSTD